MDDGRVSLPYLCDQSYMSGTEPTMSPALILRCAGMLTGWHRAARTLTRTVNGVNRISHLIEPCHPMRRECNEQITQHNIHYIYINI